MYRRIKYIKMAPNGRAHLEVRNREKAVAWYSKVLYMQPMNQTQQNLPVDEPLSLSGDRGVSSLALFLYEPGEEQRGRTIALRISGKRFLGFSKRLSILSIRKRDGSILTPDDATDHYCCWSYYFIDPEGNPIEIVSYDYAIIKEYFESIKED